MTPEKELAEKLLDRWIREGYIREIAEGTSAEQALCKAALLRSLTCALVLAKHKGKASR